MGKTFAVLDFKTDEISAVYASWGRNNEYIIKGYENVRARGVPRGIVKDLNAASDTIAEIFDRINKKSDKKVHEAYVGITPAEIDIEPSSYTALLSKYGKEISRLDVDKIVRMGSILKLPEGKTPLHKIVRGFTVDGETGIRNPMGLEGVKLGVEMNIITVNSAVLNNLDKCIALAGYSVKRALLSGIAYPYRLAAEEDYNKFLVCLNIGHARAEGIFFNNGALMDIVTIPVGLDDLGADKSGDAAADRINTLVDGLKSLKGWHRSGKVLVTCEGMFDENVSYRLSEASGLSFEPAVCRTRPFEHLPPERMRYANCLGMLDFLQEEKKMKRPESNILKSLAKKSISFINKYF